jgi:hypothetical protein
MTRISVEIPASIHERAKVLAKQDGVSLDQLIALALAEKMSALDTDDYLRTRAARSSREKFDRALGKISDRKPFKWDTFKPTK